MFQEDGSFVPGDAEIVVEVVKEATPRIVKVGVKPTTTTVPIPKGLEYELDFSSPKGEPEELEAGQDGVVPLQRLGTQILAKLRRNKW